MFSSHFLSWVVMTRTFPTVNGPDGHAKADATQMVAAQSKAAPCQGIARRISFSTPEGEVKGVAPVKFLARTELKAPVQINRAKSSHPLA